MFLRQIFLLAAALFLESMAWKRAAGVSDCCAGFSRIHILYRQGEMAMDFAQAHEIGDVVCFHDIATDQLLSGAIDMHDWRDVIRFPDLESMNWADAAVRDTAHVDRINKLACCFSLTGSFNRLEALMGTCEAMIAMVDDPEEVNHFFTAYTDFRLRIIDKYLEFYKPDIVVHGDDVAASGGLFFSPEIYRKLIWPHEQRLHRAVVDKGMIAEHHVCGKVDAIIPDIIAAGASVWQTGQHMNDLSGIQKKYGNQLCIHGGWNSYGRATQVDATEEEIRAEVRRCIDAYGGEGNFMLFPILFGDPEDPRTNLKRQWCSDECRRYKARM